MQLQQNEGNDLVIQVMRGFRRVGRYCNQPKNGTGLDGYPTYLYSSESVPNSEPNQAMVRSELRLLRLEASSPALSDTEAYFPM